MPGSVFLASCGRCSLITTFKTCTRTQHGGGIYMNDPVLTPITQQLYEETLWSVWYGHQ